MQNTTATTTKYGKREYRQTSEAISALTEYVTWHQSASDRKSDICIASYLADYFKRLDNHEEKEFSEVYRLAPYLPKLVLRAMLYFDESEEDWVKEYRLKYLEACNGVVSPTGAKNLGTLTSCITRSDFVRIAKEAMPEYELDYSIVEGAMTAIMVYVQDFASKVYVGAGMYERISSSEEGIGGIFGETKLLTYDVAGRIMLTFSRGDKCITLIASDTDNLALSMGIQSWDCSPIEAMIMLEDVIRNYDSSRFKEDSGIYMV